MKMFFIICFFGTIFFVTFFYPQKTAISQSVAVSLSVEPGLTVSLVDGVAQVRTNWELGYTLSLDNKTFLVSAIY